MQQYDAYFQKAGQQYNVDPALLRAVALVESGGDPKATSPVGAQGLTQIMPATAAGPSRKDHCKVIARVPDFLELTSKGSAPFRIADIRRRKVDSREVSGPSASHGVLSAGQTVH